MGTNCPIVPLTEKGMVSLGRKSKLEKAESKLERKDMCRWSLFE